MEEQTTTGRRRFSFRRGILYGLLGFGALGALLAAQPIAAAVRGGGGFHGMCGRGGGHAGMSPEAMHEHLQVGVKWALRDVDATDEQQAKVGSILAAAIDDVHALRERHETNRDEFRAVLGGAAVDRAALERLRVSELALADEASRRLVKAVADVSEVLTPEQRQALLERHGHRR